MHITDFSPLSGLTRLETLERMVILYALKRFPATFSDIVGNRSKTAKWLGIGRFTLYRKLSFYNRAGCPIEIKEFKKGIPKITSLLIFLNVPINKDDSKTNFWDLPMENLKEMLVIANKNRLDLLKKEHPDMGGSTEKTKKINNVWNSIKRIYKKHSIVL